MSQKSTLPLTSTSSAKTNKYDDWICLLCQNHNYSFRLICNRCHLQTKDHNAYMTLVYQQQLELAQARQDNAYWNSIPQMNQLFPNVVLLEINDDPWEQNSNLWETNKPINVKWINHLIEQ